SFFRAFLTVTDVTIVVLSFLLNATATTDIYTLSLHDALPISITHGNARINFHVQGITAPAAGGFRFDLEFPVDANQGFEVGWFIDRKSTRLNSSHVKISYAVFCLKKKKIKIYL